MTDKGQLRRHGIQKCICRQTKKHIETETQISSYPGTNPSPWPPTLYSEREKEGLYKDSLLWNWSQVKVSRGAGSLH